jgi:HSP20 family protein
MNLVKRSCKPVSIFDELFNFRPVFESEFHKRSILAPVDVESDENNIYVKTELAGMDKKEINVEYKDGILTISGEKKDSRKASENDYRYSEISLGRFQRSVNIGQDINFEKAKAEYKNGLLEIQIPKKESQKQKKLLIG